LPDAHNLGTHIQKLPTQLFIDHQQIVHRRCFIKGKFRDTF
jgi:hypothetical protein